MGISDYAGRVNPSGYVYDDYSYSVRISYGSISPDTYDEFDAWRIAFSGNLYVGNDYGIHHSYGIFSPGAYFLYGDGMSHRVDSSGNVDMVNDNVMQFRNVTDSYRIAGPILGRTYIFSVSFW